MQLLTVKIVEDVAVITLVGSSSSEKFPYGTRIFEHRINPAFVVQFNKSLDKVEENPNIRGLVVTGEGRYFCNGLDLIYIKKYPIKSANLQRDFQFLLARLLKFSLPTVAYLNGHCCAAGAMLSLAFDYRLCSRQVFTDYPSLFFIPALDIGLTYSQGMIELFKAKLPQDELRDIVLFGFRRSFAYLISKRLIQEYTNSESNISIGISFMRKHLFHSEHRFFGKQYRSNLSKTKEALYSHAISSLINRYEDMGFSKGNWSADGRVSKL